jgi:hypothetical protein
MLTLGLCDLAVAIAASTGLWMFLGVFAELDSNPPLCANYFGHPVNCALQSPMDAMRYVVFGVLFTGLIAFQAVTRPASPSFAAE